MTFLCGSGCSVNWGVRYMTLSAYFYNDRWGILRNGHAGSHGLRILARTSCANWNAAGIMVDISHVSDKTFYDALEVSKAP